MPHRSKASHRRGQTSMTRILLAIFIIVGSLLIIPMSRISAQGVLDPACDVTNGQEKSSLCPDPKKPEEVGNNSLFGPNGIATRLITLFSAVIGIAGVIAITIGGFQYVISSGDQNNINNAKNTILYAVIGLAVAAVAQLLVRFVLYNVK